MHLPFWQVYATVARVNDVTPEEARAALAAAGTQAAGVRRSDRQFRSILLGLATVYVAGALLVSAYPHGGSRFAGIALIAVFAGGLIGMLLLVWRIRAYSRRGILGFTWSAAAFSFWNAAVIGVSEVTRWWGPHQPGSHFFVSAIVAAIPLVVAAWLIGRWR
jgi:hypothetical protein